MNAVNGRYKGGVYSTGSELSIGEGALFSNNNATARGGAIHATNPKSLNLKGVTFRSNSAEYGGAILVVSTTESSRTFQGCIFDNNMATDGGALYFYTSVGMEEIEDSVFTRNYASKILGYPLFGTRRELFAVELTDSQRYFGTCSYIESK